MTVFHYGTNKSFDFGEYHIIEKSALLEQIHCKIHLCHKIQLLQFVCLLERLLTQPPRLLIHQRQAMHSNGFGISMLFLFVLLKTYGIFNELRTLPGLNLMNLAISMMLSHLIWLIGTAKFQETKTCERFGVIEHFLFLVTFVALSVISYHSCVVFSQPFYAGVSSNS